MKSPYMPPEIQAVGLACVPIDEMPAGPNLAHKPVVAAVLTLSERDDGHRDVTVKIIADVQPLEFPLPASINDALIAGAPTIITEGDRDVLTIEATARRFFVEPKLAALAKGQGLIDPVAMIRADYDETALCRRLGISVSSVSDLDVARWWDPTAPAAVEGVALVSAVSRLMLWAHCAAYLGAMPDAFFETLLPLRERLLDIEADRPEVKTLLASRPCGRAASFASYYHEYRAKRDAGDEDARWATFEPGLYYV